MLLTGMQQNDYDNTSTQKSDFFMSAVLDVLKPIASVLKSPGLPKSLAKSKKGFAIQRN